MSWKEAREGEPAEGRERRKKNEWGRDRRGGERRR
jgi:hypothetical protein